MAVVEELVQHCVISCNKKSIKAKTTTEGAGSAGSAGTGITRYGKRDVQTTTGRLYMLEFGRITSLLFSQQKTHSVMLHIVFTVISDEQTSSIFQEQN